MYESIIIGVISGIIASLTIILAQFIKEYNYRKSIEKCKLYKLENIGQRDNAATPEYPRETEYVNNSDKDFDTVDIIKLNFPFDIKHIEIFENEQKVYPTDNIGFLPSNESIYVNCKLTFDKQEPLFVVKCKTFRHEYREYVYIPIYKYSGGFSDYRLKLVKQKFILK